jgi:hypothetical protein
MKNLKKAELIDLCHAYEQVILNAVADLAENVMRGDVQYNMYKDIRNIQIGRFGEVIKDNKDARLAAYYKTQKDYWMDMCLRYKELFEEMKGEK